MTHSPPAESNPKFSEACRMMAELVDLHQLSADSPTETKRISGKDLNQLKMLIDSSENQIWFIDREKRLFLANEASGTSFFDRAKAGVKTGMTSAELLPPDQAEYFDQVYARASEGKIFRFNHPGPDGREFAVVIQPVYSEKKIIGLSGFGCDITELHQLQEELRRFEQIISSTPDLIALIDRNYDHQIINDSYLGAFNKTRKELLEINFRELIAEEHFRRDSELNLEISFSGETAHAENWINVPELGTRLMAITYQPLRSQDLRPRYVVINCRDITAMKQAEDDRRRVFDTSPDMLCSADFDGYFKELNQAWTRTLGWSAEELKSCPWIEFIVAEDRQLTIEANLKLKKGENLVGFESRCRCKDGSSKWLSWSSFPDLQRQRIFSVIRDITLAKKLENELRHLATTDPLTGASNRRHFIDHASRELKRSCRYGIPLAALLIDIDHFKKVNDTYGHDVGDEVLKKLVECCLRELRETDIFGRFGGEEFAALLIQTDQDGALQVCERLKERLGKLTFHTDQGAFGITVSVGLSMLSVDEPSIDSLLKRADDALYRAKNSGRNKVIMY